MLSIAAGRVALCKAFPLASSPNESAVSVPDTRGQDETGNGSWQLAAPWLGSVTKASAGQDLLCGRERRLGGRAGERQGKWLFF